MLNIIACYRVIIMTYLTVWESLVSRENFITNLVTAVVPQWLQELQFKIESVCERKIINDTATRKTL